MIATKQTILHDPENGIHGNCFSAVLASLLHLKIEDVPVFINPNSWRNELNQWLRQYGLAYVELGDFKDYIEANSIVGLWHETAGTTTRFDDVLHACVGKDCEVVFDPHPNATGLKEITGTGVFISLRPWEYTKANKPSELLPSTTAA